MSPRSCLFFLLLSVASSLYAELNLSPQKQEFQLDGAKISHLVFQNGTEHWTTYQPPPSWTYAGSDNQLQLKPPGKSQVEVTITKIDPQGVISFEEANHEKIKQKAIASLPEGSSNVKVESEELNSLRISGRDTYLVQVSYTHFGEKFKRYLLLLSLTNGQLQFQLTSREQDYQELMQAFQKSLYSWQHLT